MRKNPYVPSFQITNEIVELVSEISEQVGRVGAYIESDLPSPELRKENHIKSIQASLAIEHNTLSVAQVTDIVNGKHVVGTLREIQEVKNAIVAYDKLVDFDAYSKKDFLKAHGLMMQGLVAEYGKFRFGSVGVFKGGICIHMAPESSKVPNLISDLFYWVKNTAVHPLVKSCVFHYELEYIHPFADGNGRMGRFWQTSLLTDWRPVFAWIPVETIVKKHQQEYYKVIGECDKSRDSTVFVEFMLRCMKEAVETFASLNIKNHAEKTVNVLKNVGIEPNKLGIVLEKVGIDPKIVGIPCKNNGIEEILSSKKLTAPTRKNIVLLYNEFALSEMFGGSDVQRVLKCSDNAATAINKKMYELSLVEKVSGHGKGKYKFKV